jgi:hypothetical protein
LCQYACDASLLAEPERLIVDFVLARAPQPGVLPGSAIPFAESHLGTVWADIHAHKDRTFILDRQQLKRFDLTRTLWAYFHSHFSRGGSFADAGVDLPSDCEDLVHAFKQVIATRRSLEVPHNRVPIICEHASLLVTAVFCIGLSPFPEAIDAFWDTVGITSTESRVEFTHERLGFLLREGPFWGMAALMAWQSTIKYDPGNFFDCYHLLYIPHVEAFVTGDRAFHVFRERHPDSINLAKVVRVGDVLGAQPGKFSE